MSRESEVVALLRADDTLNDLLPGGIYARGVLGVEGISDPITAPDAWAGGVFQPSAIVGQGPRVPTGELVDLKEQQSSQSQRVEVYVYASDPALLEPAQDRIYTLLQGTPLERAWEAAWVLEVGPLPAEELGGVSFLRADYQIVSIRRPQVA